jgi:hypothetical protein
MYGKKGKKRGADSGSSFRYLLSTKFGSFVSRLVVFHVSLSSRHTSCSRNYRPSLNSIFGTRRSIVDLVFIIFTDSLHVDESFRPLATSQQAKQHKEHHLEPRRFSFLCIEPESLFYGRCSGLVGHCSSDGCIRKSSLSFHTKCDSQIFM